MARADQVGDVDRGRGFGGIREEDEAAFYKDILLSTLKNYSKE
jgi:hypothetical protein